MKPILLTLLLTMFSTWAFSQERKGLNLEEISKQVIPEDTAVRKGVLSNGLTYYVRRSDNPKKQAFFYLLVKAGSCVEQENERGIAHFVEHMQFKGTKHFPGSIINFCQRHGIQFGHDTNAFTGFTTVRYQLNAIPVDDALQMDSCLLLLRDWAGETTIAAKDVESEHNVIVEEWRARNTVSFAQQLQNDFYGSSIYARRNPIGDMDIVKNCSQQLVRSFYDRWYQPQNQAVVVVGDFDSDQMVEKVKKMFGDRKRGASVSPLPPAIPDNETPNTLLYADKRQPFGSIALMMRVTEDPTIPKNTVGGMKTIILGSVTTTDVADLGDKLWIFNLSAPQDKWLSTLELMAKQVELLRRKGFGNKIVFPFAPMSPEYNADSTAIILADTSFVKTSRNIQSTEYVNRCFANFFRGDAMMSDMAKGLAERHIKNAVTAEELQEEFCRITSGHNMLIGVLMTDSTALPKKEKVEAVWQRVKQMTDEQLADVEVVEAKNLERIKNELPDINAEIAKCRKVCADGHTDVFLFGIPSTGKTCILMGLIGCTTIDVDTVRAGGPYSSALDQYLKAGLTIGQTPKDFVATIEAEIMEGTKKHMLNLVEMSGEDFAFKIADNENGKISFEDMGNGATQLLCNNNRKVFFIIVDPTARIVAFNHL